MMLWLELVLVDSEWNKFEGPEKFEVFKFSVLYILLELLIW